MCVCVMLSHIHRVDGGDGAAGIKVFERCVARPGRTDLLPVLPRRRSLTQTAVNTPAAALLPVPLPPP